MSLRRGDDGLMALASTIDVQCQVFDRARGDTGTKFGIVQSMSRKLPKSFSALVRRPLVRGSFQIHIRRRRCGDAECMRSRSVRILASRGHIPMTTI